MMDFPFHGSIYNSIVEEKDTLNLLPNSLPKYLGYGDTFLDNVTGWVDRYGKRPL